MKITQALVIIGLMAISCQPMSDFEVERFFQLDSLLVKQAVLLTEKNVSVTKSVKMDDQFETISFSADTARWAKEFQIIKDFSLNKTNYIGAFKVEQKGKSVAYIKKLDQPIPINYFKVVYNNELKSVSGQYYEDKDIFQHERNFELQFNNNGLLSVYKIWGFQKMILQDTIKYDIKGTIQFPSN